jgi:hypothetical protein
MTEMKHSPGPWRNDKYHILDDANNTVALIGYYVDGTGDDVLESDANASLIAAAPEMLAALEAAKRTLWFEGKWRTDALVKVQAAIDKAKGDAE